MSLLTPLPWKHKVVVAAGIGVLALCGVSAVFGSGGVVHLRRVQAEQAAAEADVFALEQRNARISGHLSKLAGDDAYLEKVARERLGWVKPGEHIYRVRP